MKIKKKLLGGILLSLLIMSSYTNEKISANEKHTDAISPSISLKSNPGYEGEGSYYTYFSSSTWVYRDDGWTLSITPTNYLRWSFSSDVCESAFSALMDVHQYDENWYNVSSLKEQFECHFWKAKAKSTWNIEPYRTSNNWMCN